MLLKKEKFLMKQPYSQTIIQLKHDVKKSWIVMKEIIGKVKHSNKPNLKMVRMR